ncbi:MAG: cyanophycinase [Planctomycetia bacterium]|nr:cyanophycinase [Planctomycetia bacterium]
MKAEQFKVGPSVAVAEIPARIGIRSDGIRTLSRSSDTFVRLASGIALGLAILLSMVLRPQGTSLVGEGIAASSIPGAGDPASALQPAPHGTGSYEYYLTGNPADVTTRTRPGLVLMGGGADIDECFEWMIERSGGGDFLVLRTSGTDAYNSYIHEMITRTGIRPDSVATLIVGSREAAFDPFVLDAISRAEAVWIAGGDQAMHVRCWQGTPVLKAIEAAVARGVPVGGTSSGLDVLGQFLFSSENDTATMDNLCSEDALQDPFHDQITLVRDFLNLPHLGGVILESHFVQHDRMGRLVTFLGRILESGWTSEARGIGIQSNTALLVDPDGSAMVVAGPDAIVPAAYFLRITREAAMCRAGEPLVVRLATVDQVRPGETFSLTAWRGPRMVSFSLAASEGVLESSHGSRALYPE